jgi:hypothetical protein
MVANEIQHRARLEVDIEDTRPVAVKPDSSARSAEPARQRIARASLRAPG